MTTTEIRKLAEQWIDPGWHCDSVEMHVRVNTLARAVLAYLPVVEAAEAWRTGRDRNIVGTAPSGGQRSETGRALINAIDALRAGGG